ncbi:MAG: ATP-dependent DNA helicase RecG [Candidatus Faecenecus gallistercoris]|nr:ATP-dependent DNA helicase RecG [Bacillota bacterium]MDD7102743.1 ATP-dependent DNA helicase RecG [Bacillota bacterium]MDY4050688.1 ATP-dependent DNA helicase RecG [Candidatus Faecenecus gallistercoris]
METVEEVKGIGPKTVALLKKIDINTVEDLVTHYPFRYDILKRTDLKTVPDGEKVVIDGKVESVPILLRFRGGLNKLNFRLVSSSGVVGVSIFNRAFLKPSLLIGTNVIVLGKFDRTKNVVTASDIKFGLLTNQEKIEPVYHSTTGLTNKNLSTYINQALMQYGGEVPDYIPTYICDKYHFSNKKTALNILHNPPSIEKLKEAQIRLKYEELFAFMFKINYLREQNHQEKAGLARDIQKDDVQKFIDTLPFSLTGDQLKTVWEVVDDLNASKRMNRIIQGDVGSGKTIVSIIAMYANYLSGYQSALMAPTEILAKQHYDNVCNILKDTGIRVVLLTGSMTKKEKQVIYDQLESGEAFIAVGTHALIQDDVHYQNLGLVITDEQHRFGVNQRANLKNKGLRPDVLYMSATPIPRTYALTLYGDMDVSIIKEMPKGRKPVKTYVKSESEIKDVLTMMLEELKKGHQIYVIAPLIEESDNSDLTTVNELRDKFTLAFGSHFKIGLVHGKMGALQKETIMKEFQQNHIHILISTTVIEVGVDVPNATMMVIFDANRFGLSTLHQLRGRVGRGDAESTCVLISNSDTKRLQIMEETSDGFVIAEEDFKLRGHGDLFGTKQSGDMAFKIANVKSDYKILVQARDDSREYLLNKDFDTEPLKQKLLSEINDN